VVLRAKFRPSRNHGSGTRRSYTLTQLHSGLCVDRLFHVEFLKSGAEPHALRYTTSIARLLGAIWFPEARLFDCLLERTGPGISGISGIKNLPKPNSVQSLSHWKAVNAVSFSNPRTLNVVYSCDLI
jgi:hypothetical protein